MLVIQFLQNLLYSFFIMWFSFFVLHFLITILLVPLNRKIRWQKIISNKY